MMAQKDDLERYEATEAKDIVHLLRRLRPPRVEHAPPSFRANVLSRIEEQRPRRKRFTWTMWYQIPVSLTAGLALGLALAPLVLSPTPEISSEPDALPGFRGKPDTQKTADTRHPEEWLESIAELLVQGQVAEAHRELESFRNQYPDFEHNPAKK
jgi:hypothetical protein